MRQCSCGNDTRTEQSKYCEECRTARRRAAALKAYYRNTTVLSKKDPTKKRCPKCKEEQDLDAFYENGISKKTGKRLYKAWCKKCYSELSASKLPHSKPVAKTCIVCEDTLFHHKANKLTCGVECSSVLPRLVRKTEQQQLAIKQARIREKQEAKGITPTVGSPDKKYLVRGKIHYEGYAKI